MAYMGSIGTSETSATPLAQAFNPRPDNINPDVFAPPSPEHQSAIARLEADGFRNFSSSAKNVVEIAASALVATLEKLEIPREDIDGVVLSTETFWDQPPGFEEDPAGHFALRNRWIQILGELGLRRAVPYGSWLSASGNFGPALTIANALIDAGQHRNVIVVTADKIHERLPRLMHNGAAVVSDLAASCLVSAAPSRFRIENITTVSAPRLATFDIEDRKDLGKIVLETMRALGDLKRRFSAETGRSPADYQTVVAGHFHTLSLQVITDALGITPSAIRRDGRSELSHAYASDNLLTLDHLERAGDIRANDQLLLLSTGVWTWSLITLEAVSNAETIHVAKILEEA